MEKSGRISKQAKPKKNPIKVVYISSPMKVKTSVSNFRTLVQSLTGRDSDPDDMAKLLGTHNGDGNFDKFLMVPDLATQVLDGEPAPVSPAPATDDDPESSPNEIFDDIFTAEMIENFIGFSPSNLLFESHAGIIRSIDAM